jgi:hypothetical protein
MNEKMRKTVTILLYSLRVHSKFVEEVNFLKWFIEAADLKSAAFYIKIRKMIMVYDNSSRKNTLALDQLKLKFGKKKKKKKNKN